VFELLFQIPQRLDRVLIVAPFRQTAGQANDKAQAILEIPRLRFLYQPRMIHIHILQQKPGKRFYKPGLQVGLSKSSQERTSPGFFGFGR